MNIERQIQRRKAAYVQAIADSLGHLPDADREAVLEDVEDHIDSALYEGAMVADLHRLDEVLNNLGPAAEYAADLTTRIESHPDRPAYFCKLAGLGLTWSLCALCIALPASLMMTEVQMDGNGESIQEPKSMVQLIFLVIAWISLPGFIGGPTLSSIAISKIRSARGALYGLQPAVIGLYLLPLAIFDLLFFGFADHFLSKALKENDGNVKSFIEFCLAISLLAWNIWTVRRATNRLSQSISPNGNAGELV